MGVMPTNLVWIVKQNLVINYIDNGISFFRTMSYLLIQTCMYFGFSVRKNETVRVHRFASVNRTNIDMDAMSLKAELSQRLCLSPEPLQVGCSTAV